ncbi:MAG: hypothetical protein ACI8T1_000750 [Verrucomicrobiales bacterium]
MNRLEARPTLLNMKSIGQALAGGILGGFLGYHAFFWAYKQGFYAMILPGALIGFGASFAYCRHLAIPIVCALGALGLGLFTQGQITNGSWSYFISNLAKLKTMTWVMISLGSALAFWLPFSKRGFASPPSQQDV